MNINKNIVIKCKEGNILLETSDHIEIYDHGLCIKEGILGSFFSGLFGSMRNRRRSYARRGLGDLFENILGLMTNKEGAKKIRQKLKDTSGDIKGLLQKTLKGNATKDDLEGLQRFLK